MQASNLKNPNINFVVLPSPYLIDDLSFPNLGVLYLSSVLKEHNYGVSVIDLHGHADNWKQKLAEHADAPIWGISSVTPDFPIAVDAMNEIRTHHPDAHVIIGGPMATCDYRACLSAGFDQVVVGEGERAILKIMAGCREKVIKEPYILNLDEIPLPDRDAIDIHRYRYSISGKKSTNILTSRGCYWSRCKYCCQVWDKKIRYRSAKNVISEIESLRGMGFNGVSIADDEFFFKKNRDFEICEFMKEAGMSYRCLTRSDIINEEVAGVAAGTGCSEVLLGIETGSRSILDTIHKGVTVKQNETAIRILKEHGIRVKALFMVGLPGESRKTIEETKSFIERTRPDICEFTIFTPYPNTDFWQNPGRYDIAFDKQKILGGGSWYKGKKGGYTSYVRTSGLTEDEILKIRNELDAATSKRR